MTSINDTQGSGPDFIIIGAMKAGTSTLYSQLAAQTGVFMTSPKEPNFFSDDLIYARGLDWYRALFASAKSGELKGEASTHYTKLPTYPDTVARMSNDLEAPKLIYVIRNPVARAVSHYLHEVSTGRMSKDAPKMFSAHSELVAYGQYAMQIIPFIEAFGRDRVYLSSLEQLKTDPDSEMFAIASFLGTHHKFAWDHKQQPQNISSERIRQFPMHKLFFANPVATRLRRALIPHILRTKIRKARIVTERPALPDQITRMLEAEFLRDHARLSHLFPDHPALRLCYPFIDDAGP